MKQSCTRMRFIEALVLSSTLLVGAGAAQAADKSDDREGEGWFIPKNTPAKNFYGGVGIQFAKNDAPDSNQDGSVTGVQTDETGIGYDLFVGYQINDTVAIQGGYRDLGEAEFSGTSSGGPSWAPGSVRTDHEADGWELGVMGRWPITDRWYALGFLGWFWWESTETYNESGVISQLKESGSDVTFALGFEYDVGLKDRIVYRFMGSHHQVGDLGHDVNGASAEMVYRFP